MKEKSEEFKCTEKCEGCVSKKLERLNAFEMDPEGWPHCICSLHRSPVSCGGPFNWEQHWKEAGAL